MAGDDLSFTVELWSAGFDKLEATLVRASDLLAARAAFESLAERRPGAAIMLRQKTHVVLKSGGDR